MNTDFEKEVEKMRRKFELDDYLEDESIVKSQLERKAALSELYFDLPTLELAFQRMEE